MKLRLNDVRRYVIDSAKKYRVIIGLTVIVFLLTGFSINAALLIISIAFAYLLFGKISHQSLISTKVFQLIGAVFFYILVLQSVSLVTWLIWHSFPLSGNIFVSLLLILATYFVLKTKKRIRLQTFSSADIAAIFITIAALGVFVLLPIHNTDSQNLASRLISLANYNVDDGSHINLLNARLHFNVAATVGNKAEVKNLPSGSISYPSGWPAANAAVIQAVRPAVTPGSETFIAYVILKTFWFLLLVFVVSRSAFTLFSFFSGKQPGRVSFVVMSIGLILCTSWFLVDPYFYGFFSFIPQLITVTFFILSLIQLSIIDKKNNPLLIALMMPVILAVGSALSWLLLFPVFTIAIVLSLFVRIRESSLQSVWQELKLNIGRYAIFYIVVIVSLLAQIYMILHTSSAGASGTFVQSLLLNGGVIARPASFYTLLILGVISFIVFTYKRKVSKYYTAILNYAVAMLVFVSFIFALQLYKVHENLYYYFKTFDTVALVAVILCIVGIGYLIDAIQKYSTRYLAGFCGIAILSIALQFAYPNPPFFGYAHGSRALSAKVDAQVYQALQQASKMPYSDQNVTIFYPDSNPVLNEVASTLVQSSRPFNNCYNALKGDSFSVKLSNFNTQSILDHCATTTKVTYYVEPKNVDNLRNVIATSDLTNRVTVRAIAE